ncbi:MAG: hypothetical protein JNJ47_05920 [Alphaproteobacteria bacterium]|nr:hypothetical protein [Alphaproteobacteria bacterium]
MYKEKGEAAYKADYSRCGKTDRHHFSEDIVNQVNFYREGQIVAYYVYSILKETYPEDLVPSPRTMQRMWEKAGGTPRKKRRKGQSANSWTKEVHHTWQIDGKEQIRLGSGEEVSWVNIADEATSTSLHAEVFPPQEDI